MVLATNEEVFSPRGRHQPALSVTVNKNSGDSKHFLAWPQKNAGQTDVFIIGAESRNRTGTGAKSQQILSLLRLPIPPYPQP